MSHSDDERKIEKHESYGLLQVNRVSHGGETVLFGSSIPHGNTIRLSIHPAELDRHLNYDSYFAKRAIIEVEMSSSQFAEAITNPNSGSGTPVTIRRMNGKQIEAPNFTNKRLQFEEEFRDKMEDIGKQLRHLTENAEDILLNKKTINKGDRQEILQELNRLRMEISSNIPFMADMFNEQMDKTTKEAKAEVEAFTTNTIHQLGFEKLEELRNLIPGDTERQPKQIADQKEE